MVLSFVFSSRIREALTDNYVRPRVYQTRIVVVAVEETRVRGEEGVRDRKGEGNDTTLPCNTKSSTLSEL